MSGCATAKTLVIVAVLVAGAAWAPFGPSRATQAQPRGRDSTSHGGPADGYVEGAVPLPSSAPGLRFNRRPEARFGTVEMVDLLVAAAARVAREAPGSELLVNDLGLEGGGPIPRHASHRAGRDVDVLFYLLDENGAPRRSVGAPIDPELRGTDYRDLADPSDDQPLRLDAERTWRFVAALVEIGDADPAGSPLQRIFVVEHVRSALLEAGTRLGSPSRTLGRVAEATCQPSTPHDDHLHLRFFCSADDIDAGCEDTWPMYPWRRRQLGRLGRSPRRYRPRADRVPSPTVSAEEARASAGRLHPSVEAFLDRRRAWSRQPHPGRTYCR